ncbi:hypothetical protein ABLO27_07980 [Roseibium sp. SCPC15]|uniref:hypothetical protein n=1 Tax=Roseibium sp. SCP15 TaxID=3141376 RepID=UPI00333D34D5
MSTALSERNTAVEDVTDVVDFFLAWNNHRETVLQVSDLEQLNDSQKKTLLWLVKMVDRMSLDDLAKDDTG